MSIRDAILKLLPKIPETEDSIYWNLIQGACSFTDKEAMECLSETILHNRATGLSRDPIFGLAKNKSPSVRLDVLLDFGLDRIDEHPLAPRRSTSVNWSRTSDRGIGRGSGVHLFLIKRILS